MCFVFIWEQTATCATYSINWLVFMESVYSAVRTGSLKKAVCVSCLKGSCGTWYSQEDSCVCWSLGLKDKQLSGVSVVTLSLDLPAWKGRIHRLRRGSWLLTGVYKCGTGLARLSNKRYLARNNGVCFQSDSSICVVRIATYTDCCFCPWFIHLCVYFEPVHSVTILNSSGVT